jgi:20S proteasome alpha/beta subunit
MTMILGLECDSAIVIAGEQEEAAGYTAKRKVRKLKLIRGDDWAVVLGGQGIRMS